MKKLATTLLLMILTPLYAASLTFGTPGEYVTASKACKPGDTLTAQASMTLTADCEVPGGITLDLGGYTLNAPPPDASHPDGYRFLRVVASGTTIQNGTIDNALWGAYTAYSCNTVAFRNLVFTRVHGAALKVSATGGTTPTMVSNLLIENITVTSVGHPTTLVDLGPGSIGATSIKHVSITGPPIDPNYNNTACDGLGVEDGQGPILIDDVTIVGAPGDGCDIKNLADLTISNLTVKDVNRNGLKIWCTGVLVNGAYTATAKATATGVKISGCGLEAIATAAGDVTLRDSSISSPTMVGNLGNGTVNGARFHAFNTSFNRVGAGANAMFLTDGGGGAPILPDPVRVDFTGCSFDPGNANAVILMKPGSPQQSLTVADARAGKWPANFVGCSVGASLPPTPPAVPPTPTALDTLTATVTALSAKVDALSAAQAAKWAAVAAAVK